MKKLIAALLLLALSGVAAFYLKDYIDSRNPLYAIPQIEVYADRQEVPVTLAGYRWGFANGREVASEVTSKYTVETVSLPLMGGETLEINLLYTKPIGISISRMDPGRSDMESTAENLSVPYERGVYLYEVIAVYEQGFAVYYFSVIID